MKRLTRARWTTALALGAIAITAALAPGSASADSCPTVTGAKFAGLPQLRAWNQKLAKFGPRPTGSPSQKRYVNWLDGQLGAIKGVKVTSLHYRFNRWLARETSLHATLGGRNKDLPLVGPVPYSHVTGPRGITAPMVHLPAETPITAANSGGKIVVRDLVASSLKYGLFDFVSWFRYDPDHTIDPNAEYKREFLNSQPSDDMAAADAAGAAGVIFVHELPRKQIEGQYRPYDGIHWLTPGVQLGIDEGTRLEQAIAAGTAGPGHIVMRAQQTKNARTRSIIGHLPGPGKRRIVVETHSDGMNAVWDNGNVPILAIAHYFAKLPKRCRPGPMEFLFTTAHLYQHLDPSQHGAGDSEYAKVLDGDYDRGTVGLVLTLEHLGARDYEAVPRGNGLPGLSLVRTNTTELSTTFVSESDFLVNTLEQLVQARDVRRSLLMKGTALADNSHVPPYCSFGGEATPYEQHLIPSVGFITSPWILFDPGYGLKSIDFRLLRQQTLMFSDFLLRLRGVPQEAIAGAYTQYRQERAQGKPTCAP
jgi:hypothetical protein